jgi:hypothetical protein
MPPITSEWWAAEAEVRFNRLVQEGRIPADAPGVKRPSAFAALAPGHQAAVKAALAAQERVSDRITVWYKERAARAPYCGLGRSFHMRRIDGACQDLLVRPHCGKSSCPFCWRRRKAKSLHRAADCLVGKKESLRQITPDPKLGKVHVGWTDWNSWQTVDRRIRREHGGTVGRLRVRLDDDRVLMISSMPFDGSRPAERTEATDLAAAAICQLHRGKHSLRILGAWYERPVAKYKKLSQHEHLDLRKVRRELKTLGIGSDLYAKSGYQGLAWRAKDEATLDLIWMLVTEKLRPGFAPMVSPRKGPKSDEDISDSWETPFDSAEREEDSC